MENSLEVLKFPDPRLRAEGKAVNKVTPELRSLAQNMLKLMYQEKGVGLAAVQVNKPVRLFVADTQQKNSRYEKKDMGVLERKTVQPLIFFNPEIVHSEGEVLFQEGCLSFPSYYAEVKRAEIVEVQALNIEGEAFSLKTDGLLSICIQHEIDHLDGRLFIDHLSSFKARQLSEKIKKYGYPDKKIESDLKTSSL